jgi:predicted MPP superfamily phosphohydrolase
MPLAYGLIHPVDLALSDLPPELQGLRIAHLSDLHISRQRPRHDQLISQLSSLRLDMVVLTGDYMMRHMDSDPCAQVLQRIVDAIRPRLGFFGVFGNHDSPELASQVADRGIHWLGSGVYDHPDCPIQIMGIDQLGDDADDSTAMLLNGDPLKPGKLRLMLAHYPSWLSTAADLNVDLMFAGHTHGGQVRLPSGWAPTNSCDIPRDMSSGVLRHRDTLIAISRGLGEVGVPGINKWRIFCPPHVPVYTLRQGPTLGCHTPDLVRVLRW